VAGAWQDLRWPLDGEAQARSASGSFSVQGEPGALRTRIEADLEAAPIGNVALRASALLGEREAREVNLRAEVLGGSISALGRAAWAPAPHAEFDIRARGIEPARLHPQADGRLDAHVGVDVQMRDDGKPLGSVVLHALSGTLGEYPVRGEGQVALHADGFEAREIAFGTGDNAFTLSGRVGEALDLRYRIDAPALHQLWPELAGALSGQGTLHGTPAAPVVKAQLSADALRIGDARVGALTLQADVNLAADSRSRVRARAAGIAAAGLAIDEATLQLDGSRGEHRLAIAADTSQGQLSLAARGTLRDATWSGDLNALSLRNSVLGDWQLVRPVAITADAAGVRSGEGCLHSAAARLCVQADRPRPAEQTLALRLADLALTRFSPWLPPDLSIRGGIDARATAARKNGAAWTAQATLTATPTRIALAAADPPLELTLDDVRLEAAHDANGSQARVQGRLGNTGSVRGEIRLGAPGSAAASLGGELQASVPDLAPFAALLPALRDLAGRLDADLTLAGSTAQPAVRGEVNLREARATIPAAGITIERTALQLRGGSDGRFNIAGETHSGPGAITLRGEGRITDDGYNARVSATGKQFEAIKTLQVQALVSPDLVLQATPQRIAVTGSVHVPQADINIEELPPNVVQVSSDEVIRGREPTHANDFRKRLQVAVDVTLGDAVQVNAFGLDTRLSGGLAVAVQGAATPTARGTVTLQDGRFDAYGQELQIRRGRLLFAGPLDNPGLDFRAVRDAGEVVAGIEVSGSADRMRSRVFSEPTLPQAEALAWLLTGRGLSGASSDDGSLLASAAVSLGLERSEMVTREIGSALGLDELSVAPGGSLDKSALVLGKAISPRLYIRYALGVLDGEGSVKLDYKLTDRISLEAESGARQGADVIYRLER
jgi:translocation and assembly module TamB